MRGAVLIAGLLLALPGGGQAKAGDCPQARAIYGADQGAFRLTFRPVTEMASSVTHLFAFADETVTLDGMVMDTEEPVRTGARIEKNCPEGDVTGEDIRACTGFEGYVYAIGEAGVVGNLPPGDAPAAPRVLFAGLGPALSSSPLAHKLKLAPASDSFHLTGCSP